MVGLWRGDGACLLLGIFRVEFKDFLGFVNDGESWIWLG